MNGTAREGSDMTAMRELIVVALKVGKCEKAFQFTVHLPAAIVLNTPSPHTIHVKGGECGIHPSI